MNFKQLYKSLQTQVNEYAKKLKEIHDTYENYFLKAVQKEAQKGRNYLYLSSDTSYVHTQNPSNLSDDEKVICYVFSNKEALEEAGFKVFSDLNLYELTADHVAASYIIIRWERNSHD